MIQRNPAFIICPKCGVEGRIDEYHPSDTNKSLARTEYCIVHEELNYQWGTRRETKVQARRRCYMTKPHHRTAVISRLGQLLNVF